MIERLDAYSSLEQSIGIKNDFLLQDNKAIKQGNIFGKCLMCGHEVLFEINHANLRESVRCPICKAYNRQRQIIAILSYELYGEIYDLKTIVSKMRKGTKILILESMSNFAEALKFYGGDRISITDTEFISNKLKSREKGSSGITHLDIHDTGYPSDCFDIILHADVFEHVYDAPKAEAEQVRILKNEGLIVYTAPFIETIKKDDVRTIVINNKLKMLKKAIYHGDPAPREDVDISEGCIVFRIFSFPETLNRYSMIKALLVVRHLYATKYGIIGNNAYIFVVRKNGHKIHKPKTSSFGGWWQVIKDKLLLSRR